MNVNIKEDNMRGGDVPGKLDRITTVEALKGKEKGITAMSPQQRRYHQ